METEDTDGVLTTYKVFAEGCTTLPELKEFWIQNQEELEVMEKTNPDLYQKILDSFSNKKQQLTKELANG